MYTSPTEAELLDKKRLVFLSGIRAQISERGFPMALLPLRFSRFFLFVATLFAVSAFASTTPASHPLKPAVAQGAGGGFWRVDHSFKSTIALTNVLEIAPVTVTPVLYMADGTRYALDPVTLEVAGVASVDINQALSKAPAAIRSHISDFGSASIEYMW